jgi:hypothetical protein
LFPPYLVSTAIFNPEKCDSIALRKASSPKEMFVVLTTAPFEDLIKMLKLVELLIV